MRKVGTDTRGSEFSKAKIESVWQKGKKVTETYRKDACGVLIKKEEHGKNGQYGWEIDHIKPVSKGGSDDLSNLQPLHWKNNRKKADNYPQWDCEIRG